MWRLFSPYLFLSFFWWFGKASCFWPFLGNFTYTFPSISQLAFHCLYPVIHDWSGARKKYIMVFRFVVIQLRVRSPLLGLQTCFFAQSFIKVSTTVDSRYLEFIGPLWNTPRYPYLDISDLQNLEKKYWRTTFNKCVCILTPNFRDVLKILWKRGEIAPKEQFLLFSTIFCYLLLDFHV